MRTILAVLVVVMHAVGVIHAQTPPNISGTWTVTDPEGARAYSPVGLQFTVTQDATSITLASERGTVTYPFDGSEHVRTTTTVRGDTWTHLSRAQVVTNALVLTAKTDGGVTGSWEDLMVIALDAPDRLSLVSFATPKSNQRTMITRLFKYEKK